METIFEHGSPSLARQFIIAANLDLQTEKFVELKMKTLVASDFSEAFYFQRAKRTTDVVGLQVRLFTSLMDYCFLGKKQDRSSRFFFPEYRTIDKQTDIQAFSPSAIGKPNRKAISELSLVTLTRQEEDMFVRYCEGHSGLTREIGQEFLIMYYVNHSRYMEAIRMHRQLLAVELEKEDTEQFHRDAIERRNSRQQQNSQGASQSQQHQPSQQHLSKSQKRHLLIENLLMILPETQRTLLELEQKQTQEQPLGSQDKPFSTLVSRSTVQEMIARDDTVKTVKGGAQMDVDRATSHGDSTVLMSLLQVTDTPKKSLQGLDLDWFLFRDSGEDGDSAMEDPEESVNTTGTESLDEGSGSIDATDGGSKDSEVEVTLLEDDEDL